MNKWKEGLEEGKDSKSGGGREHRIDVGGLVDGLNGAEDILLFLFLTAI